MHDAFNVKKQTKIELKLLRTCCAFFAVKLESSTETTAALFQVVPRHPIFITSNDVGDEVGVVFSLFLELSADRNVVFLSINVQQPCHIFCCNAPHVELIQQNLLACSIQQSDIVANIVNRSSSVFQDSLWHLLPHFWSWFWSKFIQNALYHRLTLVHS